MSEKTLTDLVGDKIYPLVADQSRVPPYVVYRLEKGKVLIKDGGGPIKSTLQLNVVSDDLDKGKLIVKAIKKVLDQYTGDQEGSSIYYCAYESDTEEFVEDVELYLLPVQFNLTHNDN